ncbi:heavy-metal-associated domain-containing protein [Chroococcidiopsis sp. FACHB-1243]|uniref:heavy-metal-associated domain-containing protein n=1 Tax=Chroococcidiopsis sp. [FACHB-1243] TaxID=2692781 RepID=UPI001784C0BC|nr:heavy-metal-associated domain-containing protein [Chroococcidiopsis sp. [FACHB-1243]]MBD2307261.1 heavy-metal-associated domain-containing protein [Chroococcidiopsis sp. [FACHB-1243]]
MTLQLKVPKLACGACINTVTQAIQSIDATAKVEADAKTKMVRIDTQQGEAEIKAAIAAVGYPPA